ncbi:MAG: hypothetical protein QM756_30425 [Polyangiaceae bacterium]
MPLTASRLEAAQGVSDIRTTLIGGSLGYMGRSGALGFGASLGGALAVVNFSSEPNGTFKVAQADFVRAVPFVRLMAQAMLAPQLQLSLQGTVGFDVPPTQVKFDDTFITDWGSPLVGVNLGIEWAPFVE